MTRVGLHEWIMMIKMMTMTMMIKATLQIFSAQMIQSKLSPTMKDLIQIEEEEPPPDADAKFNAGA